MSMHAVDHHHDSNGWAQSLVAPALITVTAFLSGCSKSGEIDGPVKIHPSYVSWQSSVGRLQQSSTIELYLESTKQNLAIELDYEIRDLNKLYQSMPESVRNQIDERDQYLNRISKLLQPGQALEARSETETAILKSLQEVVEKAKQQSAHEQRQELDQRLLEALREKASKFFELHTTPVSGSTIAEELPEYLREQLVQSFAEYGVSLRVKAAYLKDRN